MVAIISTLIWLEAEPENMKLLVNSLLARWLGKVMNKKEKNGQLQDPNHKYGTSQQTPSYVVGKRRRE